jgi:hypothetical protein
VELVEEELTESDEDETEVDTVEWTDSDGTEYLLVPAAGNLVLTADEAHTEVGYLVEGSLVLMEDYQAE